MRPLKIAVLSHPRHPIAPPFMGGMEAHSWHLVHGLKRRGHDVTLIAAGDSTPQVPLHAMMPRHYDADMPWHRFHGTPKLNDYLDQSHQGALEWIASQDFDVVHNNGLHRYPPRMARRDRIPMVTSLHVPPFDVLRRAVREAVAPWHQITGCSSTHLAGYWPEGAPDSCHIVPNGIDLNAWTYRNEGNGNAVWAGRITPNKGTHLAIRAAQKASVPLNIFGVVEDTDYFESAVRPALSNNIRFGGHIVSDELADEFSRASALLFTPQWEEPFGLAAIEAMACGTPVAAIRRGAVHEVIGPCGAYAAADGQDLDQALLQAMQIDRLSVHARAAELFSIDRMLDRYEALYRRSILMQDIPAEDISFAEHQLP
ncbi:glycosyltransferase family 4 protein [Paracoccus sp. JM45]|uniref:glycosyltransferase family 4 protein n=1 Tax=Paracoccus sp. JM45 TaxID=2283626 RepID=UPI001C7227D7